MTTTSTRTESTSEWEIDRLDLSAYLKRIAYTASLAPDPETLRGLHRAHAATIAFENVDIVLGRTIELDLDSVQDKLVRRPRGGYCFEHNALFAAVLERIGFTVTRLAARVQPGKPGPRTHMLLRVEADGRPWLADVGFGASLLEPLPMRRTTARQGDWSYRLEPSDHDGWVLRQLMPEGWSELYAFTPEPQRPIDYAVFNHYTATHPRSPFVGQIVALRTEADARYALRHLELTTSRPDGSTDVRRLEPDAIADVLAERFAIELEAEEAARLRRVLSARPPGA
jgi:N-hydroxyarylamine O-acetyltransferase